MKKYLFKDPVGTSFSLMTKAEAKEFVKLNPGSYACHGPYEKMTKISIDLWIDHEDGAAIRRGYRAEIDEFLDFAFYGIPEDGWSVDLNHET